MAAITPVAMAPRAHVEGSGTAAVPVTFIQLMPLVDSGPQLPPESLVNVRPRNVSPDVPGDNCVFGLLLTKPAEIDVE